MALTLEITENSLDDNEQHLPIDVLRYETQEYIKDVATTLRVNPDFVTSSIYAVAAGALGGRVKLIDERGFVNTPSLWLCHVAPSGYGKSPVEDVVMQPLIEEQEKLYLEFKNSICDFRNRSKNESSENIPEPIRKRVFITDTTPEATYKALADNSSGLMVYREELAGWIRDFGRYNTSGEIQNLLSIWSGKTIDISRITRDGEFIRSPCLTVFGGTQPPMLKKIFGSDLLMDNGFNARFLWVFPATTLELEYHRGAIRDDLAFRWKENVKRLLNLSEKQIRFSPSAAEVYCDFWEKTQKKSIDAAGILREALLKIQIYAEKWALLTHLLSERNWQENFALDEISADCMKTAVDAMERFEVWAERVYGEIVGEKNVAKQLTKTQILQLLNKEIPIKNISLFAESLGVSRQLISRALSLKT